MSVSANPVNWFEIAATDLDRAKSFYETVLEVQISPPNDIAGNQLCFFPMEMTSPGAAGALIKGEKSKPSMEGTCIYFGVASIDPVLQRVESAGGKTCTPRVSIGEYGFIAHFADTEGNLVALHERPQM